MLHRVQPLAVDVRTLGLGQIVVVTAGETSPVSRADVSEPGELVRAPEGVWVEAIGSWAAGAAVQVVTNDEFALKDLARVRADLGLSRVTPTFLDGYLDKVLMKSALRSAGIAVPRWSLLSQVQDGTALPSGIGFPCVVKPRIGANSRGVRVIRNAHQWQSWTAGHVSEEGWQVEEFIDGQMCFVDGLITDGRYQTVMVGRYLGGLLPASDTRIFGAVDVSFADDLYERAVALGRDVAQALGADGRFATHLEFFHVSDQLVVMEVCARAPGAMVSEMARAVSGHNLESTHLRVQAGMPEPNFGLTGMHAAWISLLSRPDQIFVDPPELSSTLTLHHFPAASGRLGRTVSAMGTLVSDDHRALERDLAACVDHHWYTDA